MKPVRLEQFGPFGDEEDLGRFSHAIDFFRGPVTWGQIIGGYSDRVGQRDSAGVWFDRRATFLLPNQPVGQRVVVELTIDPMGGADNPTQIEVKFNEQPSEIWALNGVGPYRFEAALPAFLQQSAFFYLTIEADSRFVIRKATSVRNDLYGAMRIRRLYLER